MTFLEQGATWTKMEKRTRKICVADSEPIVLAGVGIIKGGFGKGKRTQTG